MMVCNSTGDRLELWADKTLLADLPNGGSIDSIHGAVTRVIRGGFDYSSRQGNFLPADAYLATYIAARPQQPAMVLFTGANNLVAFR